MKIIIHLGFPKTGSSTLQFGPFLELEKADKLHLATWRKNDPGEDLEHRPSSRLFQGKKIDIGYLSFLKNKLNVLSDESFTAPLRLRTQNFGSDIANPYEFPEKILAQILELHRDQTLDFSCLVVIREQSKLISSQYVEEYNWKRYKNIDLIFDDSGAPDLSGYQIYDFTPYLNKLENIFGRENCHFFMFEDLLHDANSVCSSMDCIFNAPNGFFSKSFKKYHSNQKKKSKFGTFAKDGKFFVPHLRDEVLECIRDVYKDSNRGLTSYFAEDKLRRYGYIDA